MCIRDRYAPEDGVKRLQRSQYVSLRRIDTLARTSSAFVSKITSEANASLARASVMESSPLSVLAAAASAATRAGCRRGGRLPDDARGAPACAWLRCGWRGNRAAASATHRYSLRTRTVGRRAATKSRSASSQVRNRSMGKASEERCGGRIHVHSRSCKPSRVPSSCQWPCGGSRAPSDADLSLIHISEPTRPY